MTATYTASSLSELSYTVVQIDDSPDPVDLPDPDRVPEVAIDKIPDKHVRRTSPGGGYQILIRHESEPDPLPDDPIDWIDYRAARDHVTKNADIWEEL